MRIPSTSVLTTYKLPVYGPILSFPSALASQYGSSREWIHVLLFALETIMETYIKMEIPSTYDEQQVSTQLIKHSSVSKKMDLPLCESNEIWGLFITTV